MKKEFSAGLIVYRNTPQGPRFLLLYHGGRYWNFPKGHIEYKKANAEVTTSFGGEDKESEGDDILNIRETSKEAAIRETFEEAGIPENKMDIKKGFRAVEKFRFTKNRELIFKVVIFYLCETTESAIKISSEHDGFGWFLYKDARYILSPYKDSQKLLKSAYDFIKPKEKEDVVEVKEDLGRSTGESANRPSGYQSREARPPYVPRRPQGTSSGNVRRPLDYRNKTRPRNSFGNRPNPRTNPQNQPRKKDDSNQ